MSASSASVQAARRAAVTFSKGRYRRLFKYITHGVLVLSILLGLVVSGWRTWHYFLSPENFPINAVVVEGRFEYLDREQVQAVVLAYSHQGFFAMQVDSLHAEIMAIPWVASASVHRVWPDRINLRINEHKPVARWNDKALLTATGELLELPQPNGQSSQYAVWHMHLKSLPRLTGEKGKSSLLWQRFVQASKALRGVGAGLVGVQSDHRGAITLQLDNGILARLGRGWFDRHLNRLVSVYAAHIMPKVENIAYIDLRYPNGFAAGQTGS